MSSGTWSRLARTVAVALMGVLLLGLLGGCGRAGTQAAGGRGEKVLRLGAVKDFNEAVEGKNLVFERLVGVDREGNVTPQLAASWEVSPDGRTYTFYLREGVKYHDGTPFNASTAKFALEWAAKQAPFGKFLAGVETPDAKTLRVSFTEYYAPFLYDLASGWTSPVICPQAVEPKGDTAGKLVRFIGTGPFKLAEYEKDRQAVLVRNDEYWGPKPEVDKVVWKTIPDPHAQIVALKAGEIDMIGITEHHSSIPYVEVPGLRQAGIHVEATSYGRYQVMEFNCQKEPFNDKRVRQALNLAVDREKMTKELFGGLAEPAYTITAPWFKYGPANIQQKYAYDPERAKRLLAEAGWRDSDGDGILDRRGKPLTFELLIPSGEANADAVAVYVQSELKKIGVDMRFLTLESNAAWERSKKGEYDMFVHHSFCLPSIPGGIAIGQKYHSQAKSWPAAYHSPELDRLIERAWTTTDEGRRREIIDEIWNVLHEETPCIPLYDIVKVVAYRDNVSGFKPASTMFDMELQGITVK